MSQERVDKLNDSTDHCNRTSIARNATTESSTMKTNSLKILTTTLLAGMLALGGLHCSSESDEEEIELLTLSAISNIFTDNLNGTLTQNTGLVWMKCAQGQVWDAALNTCGGTGGGTTYGAVSLNFCSVLTGNYSDCTDANTLAPVATSGPAFDSCNNLVFAGASDWRVPTRSELGTMASSMLTRANLLVYFPQTPDDKNFWSSNGNENESDGSEAYSYNFAQNTFAQENIVQKDSVQYVRCVRP